MIDPLPKAYPFWPDWAQDRYNECICMARQDMPNDMPLSWVFIKSCVDLAERNIGEGKE